MATDAVYAYAPEQLTSIPVARFCLQKQMEAHCLTAPGDVAVIDCLLSENAAQTPAQDFS